MADLITHIESYLGQITGGSRGDDTPPDGVLVTYFGADVPYPGMTTLITVGLSHRHLPDGTGQHQELLMHLPLDETPPNAAGILFQVAQHLIDRGVGLSRGEVLGPRGQLFEGTELTALYAAPPRYLPAEFAACPLDSGVKVLLFWLIPITDADALFVRKHGWQAFEELLAEHPNLTDLTRRSLPGQQVPVPLRSSTPRT